MVRQGMAYDEEYKVILLFAVIWFAEKACRRTNVSPIIGQILTGIVLGPALTDLIPEPHALGLLGKIGIMILVTESGLFVDLQEVRRVGMRAAFAAAAGVIFPVILTFGFYTLILGVDWKVSLAVGAALAPTSLGFSAQMLNEGGELNTPTGQLICTAAVIDDVFSLLLLAEVEALGNDNEKVSRTNRWSWHAGPGSTFLLEDK
ncbi:unnamed protein product [Discosporangium mesarthrocarpum]